MIRSAALVVSTLVAACGGAQTPVPLIGPARDVAALAGAWAGDYSSAMSGRSGSISFTLRAQGDSAFGDVVMIPTGLNRPLGPWPTQATDPQTRAHPVVLTINFVRVMHDTGSGRLAPYAAAQNGVALAPSLVRVL